MNRKTGWIFISLLFLLASCAPTPIPSDKRSFIGTWKSTSGFTTRIRADGTADLTQNLGQTDPDYDKLCIPVGPGTIKDLQVTFEGANLLKVAKSVTYAKVYRIDQQPHHGEGYNQIVLNGVTLVKQ
jgi:hypothetical protein